MRVEMKKQECLWLAALAKAAKEEADVLYEANPHRLFALRRDNMADLEKKLNAAVQRQVKKDRKDVAKVDETKQIRFIDPQYNELFRIPDGGSIVVTRPEGEMYPGVQEQWVGTCKYLDSTHVEINGTCWHIMQFAERQQEIGATVMPEPTSEVVGGYRITHRTFVGDKTFKMGHNPDAVQPYATWMCFTGEQDRNNWGHYWYDESTASTDLFRRADAERRGVAYDHTTLIDQKPSLRDTLAANAQKSKELYGDGAPTQSAPQLEETI